MIYKKVEKLKNVLLGVMIFAILYLTCCETNPSKSSKNELEIKIAGYDYDRVRAIMDGKVKHEGLNATFSVENIYDLSIAAFGPEKKYEVTEIGLIPYITRYINDDYRDYTLIPILTV